MTGVFIKEGKKRFGYRDTEEKQFCGDGGKKWECCSYRLKTVKEFLHSQTLGKGKGGVFSRTFRGNMARDTVVLNF